MSSSEPHTTNPAVLSWVRAMAERTQPARVHWCDGSEAENARLIREMVETGTLSTKWRWRRATFCSVVKLRRDRFGLDMGLRDAA